MENQIDSPVRTSSGRALGSPHNAPLLALGLAVGPVIALGFMRFAYALLLPAMKSDLDWSYATAGGINTANAAGYILGSASGAWWGRRFGSRQAYIWGIAISALTLVASAVSGEFTYLAIVRFVGGVATAVLFVVGAGLASRIPTSSAGQSVKMVGIFMSGVGVGIVLAGILVPVVLAWLGNPGWRVGWLVMGASAALALVPASMASGKIETAAERTGRRVSLAFLVPAFTWNLLYGAGYVSYMTFIIALLNAQGLSGWPATIFFITLGLASAASTLFLWAKIIDRLSSARALALVSLVVLLGLLPVLVGSGLTAALISAVIFGGAFMAGPTAAAVLSKRSLPPEARTSGIAAQTVAFSVGQGIGPVISGAMSDGSWGIAGGLWLSVILILGAGTAALFQRQSHG
ncbi:putative MFS family arabinose efflux permease [Arthrobacter globiformis]|uniref:YbfB/YjiJ family MFS transporter n=1 Tax=Arthrobacter globiformis TaxID=1665 RepID=UPI00277DD240|nr:YbfB/YjiJ family MFS transporter [Arthrobacter globiformis]MDQ1057407.1 putative MFS family arabinose efflux permease [Arthrobacter globiformis]